MRRFIWDRLRSIHALAPIQKLQPRLALQAVGLRVDAPRRTSQQHRHGRQALRRRRGAR